MKAVRVTYTTRSEYAATNEENIKKVMSDLQELALPGILYHACLDANGTTFVHTAFFKSEEDRKLLNDLASFKSFQDQLKASEPAVPPKQEIITLIGWSIK